MHATTGLYFCDVFSALCSCFFPFFFFSSRRRHTRWPRDWSSEVCSSDLLNVLVSGATNAGKTTMVNALAGAIPSSEHVITCEEVFELNLFARDSVAMQCRSANLEGKGEVPLRKLVKEALRMRPARIIIGEAREAEALDLLIALNSGMPGMTTIHANSAREAITTI